MTEIALPQEFQDLLHNMIESNRTTSLKVVPLQTINSMLLSEICLLSHTPQRAFMRLSEQLLGTAMGVADGLKREGTAKQYDGHEMTDVMDYVTRVAEAHLMERLASPALGQDRWSGATAT